MHALDNADAISGQAALLAEPQNVNTRTGAEDARNVANGVGAEAAGGWSVCTVNGPKWASTRDPPGKSMIISI